MCSQGDHSTLSAMSSSFCEAPEFRADGKLKDVWPECYAAASGRYRMAEQPRSTTWESRGTDA